ncbi:hypothetical protein [Nannocystis radixulma]|uniref:SbsA Ig-like domain-containing protein n=1 Tax=Nannocystis radixulma TaxID=2995305 RepID=A0ABT5BFF8_9BACT|nr:hypothetical protein [Nannocystis radixulma]MDC0672875.1 hypothetical protein [Nannocystis radixulma]
MNFRRKIATLFILAAACGDNESMTTETGGSPTSSPSTNTPVTTNVPPTTDTDDGTSTTAGSTDSTSTQPTTGTTSVEGGPMFLSFSANVATLTQDESVTFTALLTDPDGVTDIVGGSLRSADESLEFGPFVAAGQPGTYSISLTWAQIHQTSPIEFEDGELPRMFRAVFFDQGSHKATNETSLDLVCAGGSACDGTCTDLALDGLNCGACGHGCDDGADACESRACAPAWSECINYTDGLETCEAACQSFGESCVENGCDGGVTITFFSDLDFCLQNTQGPQVQAPCDVDQQWAPGGTAIKCCCTDTK